VTFRPSPLAYALVVLIAWVFCLAILLGRVELFFVAVPLLVPILRSPAPGRVAIEEFRLAVDPGPFMEGEQLTVTISARLQAAPGPMEVVPVLPSLLASAASGSAVVVVPATDGRIRSNSRVRCRTSGLFDLGAVIFRVWNQAGVWVGETRHEQRSTVSVYPQVTLVRSLPRPRRTGAPFGVHISRKLGDATDFADIRQFTAGDRLKRINWPVSLRMRRLHVNQFYTERSGEIILLIDTFANIGRRPDASLDHCLRAAASLAIGYLRQHDRVGLMEYGGWVHWTRPASGPAQYARLLQSLVRVSISPTEFVRDLANLPETMLPWHALIIALTPLADDRFPRMVGRLAEQGRDVVLLGLRTDEICEKIAARRANHGLIRRLWLLERDQRLRVLRGHGVRAVNWSPSLPIEAALVAIQHPAVGRRAA
jgi:uncharacterized protein (DUF58 family)